jgi:hypothetical protein
MTFYEILARHYKDRNKKAKGKRQQAAVGEVFSSELSDVDTVKKSAYLKAQRSGIANTTSCCLLPDGYKWK